MDKVVIISVVFTFMSGTSGAPQKHQDKLIEGDILLTAPLKQLISENHRARREVTADLIKRWKNSIVPYTIDARLGKHARRAIRKAIKEFHKHTCVEFVPRTNQKDFVHFQYGYGCYSPIGRQGGLQKLVVGEGCEYKGTVMHELMHGLGFFHEHSRFDRDKYVKILWWNIDSNFLKNFESYSHGNVDTLDVPYDYNSLMHYEKVAFSKNRKNTIQALDNPDRQLGQLDSFSSSDIKQLLKVYQCRKIDKDPLPAQPLHTKKKENTGASEVNKQDIKNTQTKHQGNCKDSFPSACKTFASHKGYCQYWKTFMEKQCPVACGMCNPVRFSIWTAESYKRPVV